MDKICPNTLKIKYLFYIKSIVQLFVKSKILGTYICLKINFNLY